MKVSTVLFSLLAITGSTVVAAPYGGAAGSAIAAQANAGPGAPAKAAPPASPKAKGEGKGKGKGKKAKAAAAAAAAAAAGAAAGSAVGAASSTDNAASSASNSTSIDNSSASNNTSIGDSSASNSTDSSASNSTSIGDSSASNSTDSSASNSTSTAASSSGLTVSKNRECDQGDQSLASGLNTAVTIGLGLQAAVATLQNVSSQAAFSATDFADGVTRLQQFQTTMGFALQLATAIADDGSLAQSQLKLLTDAQASGLTASKALTGVASAADATAQANTLSGLLTTFLGMTNNAQDGASLALIDCSLPTAVISG